MTNIIERKQVNTNELLINLVDRVDTLTINNDHEPGNVNSYRRVIQNKSKFRVSEYLVWFVIYYGKDKIL